MENTNHSCSGSAAQQIIVSAALPLNESYSFSGAAALQIIVPAALPLNESEFQRLCRSTNPADLPLKKCHL
jgi:hypothetical protein